MDAAFTFAEREDRILRAAIALHWRRGRTAPGEEPDDDPGSYWDRASEDEKRDSLLDAEGILAQAGAL